MNNWNREASRVLKAAVVRHGVPRKELLRRLDNVGVHLSKSALTNRLARGSFSFEFVLQVLAAIGAEDLHVGPLTAAFEALESPEPPGPVSKV